MLEKILFHGKVEHNKRLVCITRLSDFKKGFECSERVDFFYQVFPRPCELSTERYFERRNPS